ncbi:MAG TPA: type II toxin-antitoxin system VapC family toxin [Ideonella sp.]|nr:type II toxin-antitoxin system VapC family toxin [Ideonella sp.]
MRLLLDTHAFLWWVMDHPSLSAVARSAIADPDNECLLSIASAWEIAIKTSLGKLDVGVNLERFIPEQLAVNRFQQLPLALGHVLRVASLPWHHRDPFDRLLIAQCQADSLTLVSADASMRHYDVALLW